MGTTGGSTTTGGSGDGSGDGDGGSGGIGTNTGNISAADGWVAGTTAGNTGTGGGDVPDTGVDGNPTYNGTTGGITDWSMDDDSTMERIDGHECSAGTEVEYFSDRCYTYGACAKACEENPSCQMMETNGCQCKFYLKKPIQWLHQGGFVD